MIVAHVHLGMVHGVVHLEYANVISAGSESSHQVSSTESMQCQQQLRSSAVEVRSNSRRSYQCKPYKHLFAIEPSLG